MATNLFDCHCRTASYLRRQPKIAKGSVMPTTLFFTFVILFRIISKTPPGQKEENRIWRNTYTDNDGNEPRKLQSSGQNFDGGCKPPRAASLCQISSRIPAADDTDGFPHIRKSRGGGRRGTGCLCQALVRSRPLRQPLPPVHLDLPDMLQPLHRPPPPQEENAMALHLSFPQQEHVPNHASYPGKTASLILKSHGIGRRPIHGTRTATGL